jgi:hypothetical protein
LGRYSMTFYFCFTPFLTMEVSFSPDLVLTNLGRLPHTCTTTTTTFNSFRWTLEESQLRFMVEIF